ncbi:MAG: MobQ family relaxase [Coriobacteriales bacterium]|nr:MobQ family relaxase [Coriobacteriales bacterium]
MAIYHLHAQVISRSAGRTSVAAAAYISGTRLTCERDGRVHDYTHRRDVVYAEIFLPEGAPGRWCDRSTLWNEVEATERGKNAQLCRSFDVALPRELTRDEQLRLARTYARSMADEGMCVDFAVHDKGDGNPHVHIHVPMRACNGDGFLAKSKTCYLLRNASGEEREATAEEQKKLSGEWEKVYRYKGKRELTKQQAEAEGLHPTRDRTSSTPVKRKIRTTDWDSPEKLEQWRKRWEDMANESLAVHGSDERIDRRSYAEQGVDLLPTVHLGPNVAAIEHAAREDAEACGKEYEAVTDRARENDRRMRINEMLRRLVVVLSELIRTRRERANKLESKRRAQRAAARRRPRRKVPYAPQRGRKVSPRGGYGR